MVKVMQQFSIYLPNKPGELRKLLSLVKRLDLCAAATFASRDGAIMRLVAHDAGSFQHALRHHGVSFTKQEVLTLRVDDQPGGLLKILTKLQQAHVNLEGVYVVGDTGSPWAACVLEPDDVPRAVAALR
jgi:hypothetical protein